ncbi:MAG: ABC transporter substrate-binding protein, partial [Eubacteriales bacterium]|nr:ABC transporter substrate-binding protein [Eubacteriales bacterium]
MNAQKSSSGKIRREIKNHGKKRCIGIFAAVLSSVLLISPVCIFAAESAAAAGVGSTGAETAAEAETASESATAAGGGSTAAETAAEEPPVNSADIAYVHLAGEPGNPDPFRVMDTDTASMLGLISEGLTAIDENGDIIPGCAKRWSVSEDGLEWKFRLRRDLCWSDGDSLEAEDFAELFRKIADPSSEVLYGQDLVRNIAGYEEVLNGDSDALDVHAEGKRTLIVRLSAPDPAFARVCASRTLLPIREQIRNEHDPAVTEAAEQASGGGGPGVRVRGPAGAA